MKKLKKALAMILSLAMVLGMSATAFAETKPGIDGKFGTSDDTGTITVNGVTPEAGISVVAYQIVKAEYENNGGSFSGYKALYGDNSVTEKDEVEDNPDTPEDESKLAEIKVTDEQLAAILAKINTNAQGNTESEAGMVEDTKYEMNSSEDKTSYTAEVPVGVYLVVITGAEKKVYSNVVVSLFYKNVEGQNGIDEGVVDLNDDNANAWVKVQDNPDIEKIITNGDQDNTNKGNTVNIGDVVDYEVTVSSIPYYGGDYPTFNVVDTLDTSLDFQENPGCTLRIDDGTEAGIPLKIENEKILRESDNEQLGTYAYDSNERTLTFDFVLNQNGKKVYTLNDYQGKSIVINYSAKLNENAKVSDASNDNTVTLNYTHDSKVEGKDDHIDKETFTYTFDIDGQIDGSITEKIIAKVGESIVKGEREALPDAEFTLYKATVGDDGKWTKGEKYTNNAEGTKPFDGVITSSDKEDNNLAIRGLKAGTYILQETKAPKGYSINTHEFQIEIDVVLDDTTGKLQSWSIKIDGSETASFALNNEGEIVRELPDDKTVEDLTVAIPNTKLTELPSTGGIGTTIFTIGGCIIMIVAAGLFFASRRKKAGN